MTVGIHARLQARAGDLLLDVELDSGDGNLIVMGPNGAGKSTLLSVLLGLHPGARGVVEIGGQVVFDSDRGIDVPPEARRLGWVPQDLALFPHLTVRQNVAFGGDPDHARSVLHDLGMEAIAGRRTGALSGGERQRVALARALASAPRALLLDEPLSSLDPRAREEVRARLAELLRRRAIPAIIVTHDAEDARLLGDRIVVLEAGRIIRAGAPGRKEHPSGSRLVR